MAKQRYELEIEEILRKCEEEASRELIPATGHRRLITQTGERLAEPATLFEVESAREEETPPKKQQLTGGRRAALGWLAFIVGLALYPFFPILTLILILVPIVLAVIALREGSRN